MLYGTFAVTLWIYDTIRYDSRVYVDSKAEYILA